MTVTASGAVTGTESDVEVSSEGLQVPLFEEAMSSKISSLVEEVNEELAAEAALKATDVDPSTQNDAQQ